MGFNKVLAEFASFRENFNKLCLESGEKQIPTTGSIEMPPFRFPQWTDPGRDVNINLGLRRPWLLNGYKLREGRPGKKTLAVEISILRNGVITMILRHPLDMENSLILQSVSNDERKRMQCFMVFFQFIRPTLKKVTLKLKKIYQDKEDNKEEHERIMKAVEISFESFIPLMVADKLAE